MAGEELATVSETIKIAEEELKTSKKVTAFEEFATCDEELYQQPMKS